MNGGGRGGQFLKLMLLSISGPLGGLFGTGGGGGGPRFLDDKGELYMVGLTGRKGLGPAKTHKTHHMCSSYIKVSDLNHSGLLVFSKQRLLNNFLLPSIVRNISP